MIDLHTHTLLSDGELLPSELVRHAHVIGYQAIALTDHVDSSNIDFILPRLVKVAAVLNRRWEITVLPGVELTHVPLEEIAPLVRFARRHGAKIVVVHGETTSEPVIPGTNRAAINAGCDILAHPGMITRGDVIRARSRGVHLELSAKASHKESNKHVYRLAKEANAKLVLNTDAHSGDDLLTDAKARKILRSIGLGSAEVANVFKNSIELVKKLRK